MRNEVRTVASDRQSCPRVLKLLRESASGDSQISSLLIPTDGNALHEPLEFQFGRLGAVQNGVRGEFALMRRPGVRKGHRNAFPK